MGAGIDAAREFAPEHAAVLDNFKDQLLIVLIKRLADKNGRLDLPCAEIDDTARDLLAFSVDHDARIFHFELRKKS
jgi:hypothetical protein